MKNFKIPFFQNITLANIGDYLCTQYGVKKGDLGDFLYQNTATFRKKANGTRPIQPEDTIHLEHAITEKLCNNSTDEYFKLMKHWFPELRSYNNQTEIRTIISRNIMGQASIQEKTILSESVISFPSQLDFFQYCLNHSSPIKKIRMAYHTGWMWFHNTELRTMLKKFLNQNVSVQIIANSLSPQVNDIILTMRDPTIALDYTGVNETLANWHKYEKAYSNLTLKVSAKYPILHQLSLVEFEDGTAESLVRNYAYGAQYNQIPALRFSSENITEYNYYSTEFDFLWTHSLPYTIWNDTLPPEEEFLTSGDYLMLHIPSHTSITEDRTWTYSLLKILDQNKATLKTNITNPDNLYDKNVVGEYSYEGKIKVTGKIIYISLWDESRIRHITISIAKPDHINNRYIGIVSSLNPSGNAPTAFKCACFDPLILSKINFDLLHSLLLNNNRSDQAATITLEFNDTDLFYSNRIFT